MENSIPKEEQLELRSPEVQEIIGQIPNRLVRWGITVIFFVILSIVSICWFIQYPDLLKATVVITTNPPPTILVSRASGNLKLLRTENQFVQKGDVVAYLQTNVSLEMVLFLEDRLNNSTDLLDQKLPGTLGDLQPHYASLISAITSFKVLTENKNYERQIEQLKKQMVTYQKLGKTLSHQQVLIEHELKLSKEKFSTDSILFSQQVIASLDFNAAKINWLQQQRNARTSESALLNNEVQINQLGKQITDLSIEATDQRQKLELAVHQAYDQLKAQITKWKESYTFISASSGTLAYLGFLEDQKFIEGNMELFSILPPEGELVAKAELPIRGSGKVKVGQEVNIRLENYPFEQFGLLRGKISAMSLVPGEDKYWVTISLSDHLRTNQNKTLTFKQQLTGNTEIITEDLRLLERFFYQLRRLLQVR